MEQVTVTVYKKLIKMTWDPIVENISRWTLQITKQFCDVVLQKMTIVFVMLLLSH